MGLVTTAAKLLDLAREKFGALSPAEERLFSAAQTGEEAPALTGDDAKDDLAGAPKWGPERALRAKCIEWLCTTSEASSLVTHQGIRISGMRIDGDLNLHFAQIAFPLQMWKCAFDGNILLQDARLRALYLPGVHVTDLNADLAKIEGSVFLCEAKAQGEVRFLGATISGHLDCAGAELSNSQGKALSADGAKIEGSVFLEKAKAQGEVRFPGATIGGHLLCDRAEFSNPNGDALSAGGAKIERSVFYARPRPRVK
jgi:hypothetical protein